ncbi:MAG TPA: alpha/beta fold hydrolase [Gemmatimonadaceae bacterium]|nr:alpha/beta fold hydrolase [Gemmatimonadaceae bacterium]
MARATIRGSDGYETVRLRAADDSVVVVREYVPGARTRGVVVLIHGLLSSSDIFDVPGVPQSSLARFLRDAGYSVFSYDQRGAGESTCARWNFGLGELALAELPQVIEYALSRTGASRVELGGHSLGGLIAYVLRAALAAPGARVGTLTASCLGKSISVAGPCWFDPALDPWARILAQGPGFFRRLEGTTPGVVTRAGFIRGQTMLEHPWLGRLMHPAIVEGMIDVASWTPRLASLLRRSPLPNLLYAADDFDDETFRCELRSRALHRCSRQLLDEVLRCVRDGQVRVAHDGRAACLPDDLASAAPFDLLTITSRADRFVPAADVARAHGVVRGGASVYCEQEWGITSSHNGYFFKDGLYQQVYRRIKAFLEA